MPPTPTRRIGTCWAATKTACKSDGRGPLMSRPPPPSQGGRLSPKSEQAPSRPSPPNRVKNGPLFAKRPARHTADSSGSEGSPDARPPEPAGPQWAVSSSARGKIVRCEACGAEADEKARAGGAWPGGQHPASGVSPSPHRLASHRQVRNPRGWESERPRRSRDAARWPDPPSPAAPTPCLAPG